ncbi:MAG: UvrD-helicase domain-containing protein [Chloroflexi bacterium]|nr:UvrD-helicase domain-containing protein [Chloroflexota bacterium]
MRTQDRIAAESSRLHRLFTLGAGSVSLSGDTLHIEGFMGGPRKIPVGSIDSITVRPSWFWHRLTIRMGDGTERSIGGLDEKEAVRVRDAAIEGAVRVAQALSPDLKRLDERLRQHFAGDRYARYSDSQKLHETLAPVLRECKGLTRECLDQEAAGAIGRLAPLESVEGFEAARRRANSLFISKNLPTVQAAASEALRNPLTNEQAEAVATDEDATLVLAGAGTGKTSAIVGKVAHLVRNEGIDPDEVLVLAFNRKAADEIRGRLKGGLSEAHVHTFHSFGRRVIAESESAPTISKLAEDDLALKRAVDTIIGELLNDPEQSKAVIDFIIYHHAPYKSAFDFDTPYEYEEYVRDIELRTLSGVLVKSFEELEIANYLTEHGVEFRYEDPYETATATQQHRQYQPDFFLPGHDIYIEHFALDRNGHPPPGWRGYAEGVEWKRTIHRQRGSTLVETHSWQHRQGVLLETLRRRLEEAGIRFEQIPRQELVRQLAQEQTSWLAGLLATFLNHVKSSRLSSDELESSARQTGDRRRNESFLDVFEQVRARYQKLLADKDEVDFHDLINLAAEHIREGRWESRYRYVLVDEFQDISAGRMALLQALQGEDVAYFLVGDDWQSIYRFAGSDVGLLRNCGDLLGHVEKRTLSRTFRFADGILGPSTAFVKRNPEQTQRPLLPASEAEDEGVAIVADSSPAGGMARALQDTEARAQGRQRTVLTLGRYRQRRGELPTPPRTGPLRVEFSTAHGAKGREADYVIVLNLNDGRWGFPSKVEDDPLLELVLPPVSGGAYPFAEERRLFYVAMTRARNGAYLVTDPVQPSTFVTELLRESDELRRIGELAPECPRCRRGRLRPSRSPRYLNCSHSSCDHRAPRCPNCDSGYALVGERGASCTNQICRRPPTVCPRCGLGVLRLIEGTFGSFWGCTEYSSMPSCRFKMNVK